MKTVKGGNSLLAGGGYFSLAFAVFQVSAMLWSPDTIRYFGGPAELSQSQPLIYDLLCIVVGGIAGIMGLYAWSGAGKIRRLPLLRSVLTFTAAIYLLRGSQLLPELPAVVGNPGLIRFAVFSAIALCAGLVHLLGFIQLMRKYRQDTAAATP